MSVQAMSWVIANSKHKGSSFVVLLMIANHAHEDGSGCWAGLERLAKEARISARQVINVLRDLKKSGELSIEQGAGPHGTNLYSINMRGEKFSPEKRGLPFSPESSLTVLKEEEKRTVINPQPKAAFVPPSLKEVFEYMKEKKVPNAERQSQLFMAHHANRAWRFGNGKGAVMRNWKMAVVTWVHNIPAFAPTVQNMSNDPDLSQQLRDWEEKYGHGSKSLTR